MNTSQDIANRFREGVEAINREDYKVAKEHFEAVLAAAPGNPEALSFLGFTEASMGNVEGGLEKTTQARSANPGNPQNLVNHAYALSQAGRVDDAIDDLKAAHKMAPNELIIANQLSRLLFEAKRYSEVEGLLKELFEKSPKDPLIGNRYVIALIRNKKVDEAYEVAQKLLKRFGENPFVWGMLARAARASDRMEVAIENFQKLIEQDPDDMRSQKALSHCLMKMEMYHEVIPVLEKILKENPRSTDALYGVGFALHNTNRSEQGIPFIDRALEIEPDNFEALLIKGHNHVYMAEYEKARACYNRVLELNPDCAEAYHKLLKMDPPKVKTGLFLELEAVVNDSEKGLRKRSTASFALGETYESMGEYDKAFEFFRRGNELSNRKYKPDSKWFYRADQTEQHFKNVKRIFTKDLFNRLKFKGSDSTVPIFIVGMPRSGTTLLEQIISSHSKVLGAGELSYASNIANNLSSLMDSGSVEDMERVFAANGMKWADNYVKFLPERTQGEQHVTDKMPNNFMHLGLLQTILPKAKYLLIRRNPLDICLSIYGKQFSKAFSYARDLKTLGQYYRLFDDLMTYWKKVLPHPLLEIQYEELVEKKETMAPKILEFCGLEWEDQCLEYYKRKTNVKTMSTFQVREPINKSSVEKWRRYEKHIGPLLEGLGEDIAATLNLEK